MLHKGNEAISSRRRLNAVVIWIGLNWLVFTWLAVVQSPPDEVLEIWGLSGSSQPYALISYSFIHFRPEHLLVNSVIALFVTMFWVRRYSACALTLVITAGLVAGGFAHLWFSGASHLFLHGSSAASSALLGAGSVSLVTRTRVARAVLPATVYLGVWFGTGDGSSWAAHNGGLMAGIAFGAVQLLRAR